MRESEAWEECDGDAEARSTPRRDGRDGVHVAIAPVVAAEKLWPGYAVGLTNGDGRTVGTGAEKMLGIVDPFLIGPVLRGQRFYLFLFPQTITSLRHVWSHPDFVARVPQAVPHG